MSEEDPFTIHDKLAELIICNQDFNNMSELDDFLELLRESLVNYFDPTYEPSEDSSSTDDLEGECNIELVITEVDEEGFHEITSNEVSQKKVGWSRNRKVH